MNRDERRSRAAERPPALRPGAGNRPNWVGPKDGERGGSWIGANADGVAACLLNAYAPGDLELLGRHDIPSRGEIVPLLLARRPDEALAWVEGGLEASRYPSFTLIVLTPGSGRVIHWRLEGSLTVEDLGGGWSMITSSLWRSHEVSAWRHAAFRQWRAEGSPLTVGVPAYNVLEVPDRREWSPFMTRPFSATRSITQVRMKAGESSLTMRYWSRSGADPIDLSTPHATLSLPLCDPAPARFVE